MNKPVKMSAVAIVHVMFSEVLRPVGMNGRMENPLYEAVLVAGVVSVRVTRRM